MATPARLRRRTPPTAGDGTTSASSASGRPPVLNRVRLPLARFRAARSHGRFRGLFAAVSAARSHTCGVTPAGATYCWGLNGSGQLGNGDAAMATQLTPVLVAAPAGVTFATVSAGDYHTCGLTPGGVAYCWGDGIEGQVGDGATQIRLTPVPVSGGLTFRAVSAGQLHTCGVTPVGAAYCWGSNDLGQLGDGTMTIRSSPVLVVQ